METKLGLDFRMIRQVLDLSNQLVELNKRMLGADGMLLQLGSRSSDDNATVKVVTMLTLIYLPASLVSVRGTSPCPKIRLFLTTP